METQFFLFTNTFNILELNFFLSLCFLILLSILILIHYFFYPNWLNQRTAILSHKKKLIAISYHKTRIKRW